MNLILLSGNSKSNRKWIFDIDSRVSSAFKNTYVQDYSHWKKDNSEIDLKFELSQLKKVNKYGLNPYIIFAKSIGTILSLKAINENILKPTACLFVGFPMAVINEPDFWSRIG